LLDRLKGIRDKMVEFWNKTTLVQRIVGFALLLSLIGVVGLTIYNLTRTDFVQLYSNLSERETGEVTARLKEMGIDYQLTPDGRGISVPSEVAAQVKVDLAAEGIPQSGSITYESFANNMNFGLTDRQFGVVERDAMQNELRQMMIQGIRGIKDAQVMITLPKETIWVSEEPGEASASIILELDPAYPLEQKQINALYTLVSKSIPNLPPENIIITNQYGEELTRNLDQSNGTLATDDFQKLQSIKKEVERDIERGIERMLGTVLGPGQAVVQAFATMDYTQETRQENLVTSPNENSTEGIIISMETLNESWNSQGGEQPGGIVGPGNTDVAGYQAGQENGGNSNYEKNNEKINYEVNRITRSIVESPYRIADLSINVGVNIPEPAPNDASALQRAEQLKANVEQVVRNVVRTALGNAGTSLTDEDIANRVTVMAIPFQDRQTEPEKEPFSPWILYGLGAVAAVAVAALAFVLLRRKKQPEIEEEELIPTAIEEIPPIEYEETEDTLIRKQLERLAKEKPQDFVALLRTWIAED
jgi:flagellar M-ring protein FliF